MLLNPPINSLLPLSSSRSNSSVNTSSSTIKGQNSPRNIDHASTTNPLQKCNQKGKQLLEELDACSTSSNEEKKALTAAKISTNISLSSSPFNLFSFPLLYPSGQQLHEKLESAMDSSKNYQNPFGKIDQYGPESASRLSTNTDQR